MSTNAPISLALRFAVDAGGAIEVSGGDVALRHKIIQVLFTAPGERVNLPEFGCGLFNLVFEPNDDVLLGAVRFTVGQALNRWLADEIIVAGVEVARSAGTATVEIAYTKKRDLARQAVRIQFR